MNHNLFTKIRDKHALWYKGIVFVIAIIICTYLLPKKEFLDVSYVKTGDIWLNDDFIAPFDFLLQKTERELAEEKKQTKKGIAYFIKNNEKNYLNDIKNLSVPINKQFLTSLDSVFNVGVCSSSFPQFYQDSLIYLVENNEAKLIPKHTLISLEKLKFIISHHIKEETLLLQVLEILKPNVTFNEILSEEMLHETPTSQYIYKSKIKKGDVVLRKNEPVTQEQYQELVSYTNESLLQETNLPKLSIIIGQFLACALVLGIMMLFLAYFRKSIFSQNSQVTFIFLMIVLIVMITSTVAKYNVNYVYSVPFCLVPILIRVFFDSRTSLFNFLNIILLCAFFVNDKFEFVFIQLIAGIGTIFSVADMGKRSKLFFSALLIFIFYVLSFIAYHLLNATPQAIGYFQNYIPYLISSVCVLFSFPLIFIFEKVFGFTSDFTLLELCDLNSPLLRQLSQKIPGTFQHSLQVANLAEEACYKIGGNPLLVRTGAMYHDIGKMTNPRFFTENQVGEISPHEDLSSEESAQIIINHVIRGVEIAKENKLPETVIDFIRTHHGTTTTRFFLHNYKKEHQGEIINEDLFRYPGPIPFNKETAILMMADSVEASSRSLKKYDAVAIDELVDKIINHQINENQFINADITFRDIHQIKKIFKKRLMNIYHVRIEYPR